MRCPRCGSNDVTVIARISSVLASEERRIRVKYRCNKCGYTWEGYFP